MKIMFSGHRDRNTPEVVLEELHKEFPDAIWIHGGAPGFDAQVNKFAEKHGIPTEIYCPDYDKYFWAVAPLRRNDVMLEMADLIIICYDGRKMGGTVYVLDKAIRSGKDYRIVQPKYI